MYSDVDQNLKDKRGKLTERNAPKPRVKGKRKPFIIPTNTKLQKSAFEESPRAS
jgi:hypothetical protein